MASTYSSTARNAQADAIATLLNSGKLRIYDGAQPASPDTAITTQTMLAEFSFAASAFGAAAAGVATAAAIANVTIAATGTAAWCRCLKSDGTTAVMDGTVSTTSGNVVVGSLAFASGATGAISSFTITAPATGA